MFYNDEYVQMQEKENASCQTITVNLNCLTVQLFPLLCIRGCILVDTALIYASYMSVHEGVYIASAGTLLGKLRHFPR